MPTIYPPTTISAIPPFPALSRRVTGEYNDMAFAFGVHMGGDGAAVVSVFVPQMNAALVNANANATASYDYSVLSQNAYALADAARVAAQTAAASAVGSAASMSTSTTSIAIGSGDKVFTLVESGKDYSPGQTVVAAVTANPVLSMQGFVKAYDKPSRLLTLTSQTFSGSGTFGAWSISVSAAPTNIPRFAYEDRATLRSMASPEGTAALVSGLGLFTHYVGSTELDDDESCFATSSGRWLLLAVDFELVDNWLSTMAVSDNTGRMLFGRVYSSVATVGAGAVANILAYVDGADVGDRVLVCPARLQTSGSGFMSGVVTAPGTVNVQLFGGASGLNSADGFYLITVFKET